MPKYLKTVGFIILAAALVYMGVLASTNDPTIEDADTSNHLVLGVDVSRYQGHIDFERLYDQDVHFAFIKATEGKDYVDPKFMVNYGNVKNSNLSYGFYHFYRFEYSGYDQAQNFINNVDKDDKALPPVLDLEYYGKYIDDPMDVDTLKDDLSDFLTSLENYYGKKPIIYCNYYIYRDYIQGNFDEYDLWYRKISEEEPIIDGIRDWTFWQFSENGQLQGYGGDLASDYIDLNYFNGTLQELKNYGK